MGRDYALYFMGSNL